MRGGGIALGVALVLAACAGDDAGDGDPSAVSPEPTAAEIADAPTATPAPTASPAPTAAPTEPPTPTPTVEESPDDTEAAVIAAWERYLELSLQARGELPPPEALRFDTYLMGDALQGLQETLDAQAAEGEYVRGTTVSISPSATLETAASALVRDCVEVDLERVDSVSGAIVTQQRAIRSTVARLRLVEGRWLMAEVESGEGAECDA